LDTLGVNPSDEVHVYIYLKDGQENIPDNLNILAKSDDIISAIIPRSQLESIAGFSQVSRIDLPVIS
jgi:hypothetical protein